MIAKHVVLPLIKSGRTRGYVLVEQVPVFYVPITRTTGPRKARAIAVAASNKVRPTNLVEVGWDRAAYNVGRRAVTMLAKGRL